MIDWVTAKLPCRNGLKSGCVAKIDKDGNIEWLSQSWLSVEGSHSSVIQVKALTENTIQVSGNPTKWLQGHNLFGTNDLKWLMYEFYGNLHRELCHEGLEPTGSDYLMVEEGNYTVSRVDINETWHLNNQLEVKSWLRSAGQKVSMPYRGKGVFSGDTLYWGKGSKYFYLKGYSKGDEINGKKSNFPDELRTPAMLDYADKALRLELTLCSNFLRRSKLNLPCNWLRDTARMLLISNIETLEMSDNFKLSDDVLSSLPPKLRIYYKAWLHGEDLRLDLSRSTYYRIRKNLKEYGVDIAMVRDVDRPMDNVIPLIKVLEAKPVGIPYWAFEQDLVVAPEYEKFTLASNDDIGFDCSETVLSRDVD